MKRKKPKPKPIPRDAAWTPFQRCTYWRDAHGNEVDIPSEILVLRNSIYTVHVEQCEAVEPFGSVTWLSIKRNDRAPIHDWRDLQRIKNAICSAEREAVEIYPAESRLTDTANQYHLFVFPEGYRLPFGYAERIVSEEGATDPQSGIAAKQRPFRPDERPADLLTADELNRRFVVDQAFGARTVHRRRPVEWEARVSR